MDNQQIKSKKSETAGSNSIIAFSGILGSNYFTSPLVLPPSFLQLTFGALRKAPDGEPSLWHLARRATVVGVG